MVELLAYLVACGFLAAVVAAFATCRRPGKGAPHTAADQSRAQVHLSLLSAIQLQRGLEVEADRRIRAIVRRSPSLTCDTEASDSAC